jgi:hypothetical protein
MEEGVLLKKINREVEDFKSKTISIVPGLYFNQYDTLVETHFAWNSKFQTGDIDDEGDRKFYRNVVRNPAKVGSKAVDFDTKNIRLLTVGGGDPIKTWFMERDLKYWMREKKFGKILNRIFNELPVFGSVVLKIVDGTPYFVDLRNFVIEQGADDLDCTNYIIEIHNYTPAEFRKVAKQMKWKESDVKEVIEKFHQMKGVSHIKLYERYGEVEKDGEWAYKRVFIADVGNEELDRSGQLVVAYPGVTLSIDDFEGHPYREFHWDKVPGRWLGVGVVETLREPQIAVNLNTNLQAKTAFWAALRVFQSQGTPTVSNLATDVRNGEVLNSESPITQIDMSDRNLAFFNDQDARWFATRDENTFAFDGVQGQRAPASTPLGETQLNITQNLSYFEQIQENIAMDVKEMLYDDIIPQFEKDSTAEHTLRLVGKDLDQYIELVKNELVAKEVMRMTLKALGDAPFPTNEDRDAIGLAVEEAIKQGKEKILTVPKGFYKGLKYDVDIDITGESVDTRVRAATKFAILQAITADPTMTQDPTKRKLLASYAEDGGINPNDFLDLPKSENTMMQMGRAGGGVSAPEMGMKVPGPTTQTV